MALRVINTICQSATSRDAGIRLDYPGLALLVLERHLLHHAQAHCSADLHSFRSCGAGLYCMSGSLFHSLNRLVDQGFRLVQFGSGVFDRAFGSIWGCFCFGVYGLYVVVDMLDVGDLI